MPSMTYSEIQKLIDTIRGNSVSFYTLIAGKKPDRNPEEKHEPSYSFTVTEIMELAVLTLPKNEWTSFSWQERLNNLLVLDKLLSKLTSLEIAENDLLSSLLDNLISKISTETEKVVLAISNLVKKLQEAHGSLSTQPEKQNALVKRIDQVFSVTETQEINFGEEKISHSRAFYSLMAWGNPHIRLLLQLISRDMLNQLMLEKHIYDGYSERACSGLQLWIYHLHQSEDCQHLIDKLTSTTLNKAFLARKSLLSRIINKFNNTTIQLLMNKTSPFVLAQIDPKELKDINNWKNSRITSIEKQNIQSVYRYTQTCINNPEREIKDNPNAFIAFVLKYLPCISDPEDLNRWITFFHNNKFDLYTETLKQLQDKAIIKQLKDKSPDTWINTSHKAFIIMFSQPACHQLFLKGRDQLSALIARCYYLKREFSEASIHWIKIRDLVALDPDDCWLMSEFLYHNSKSFRQSEQSCKIQSLVCAHHASWRGHEKATDFLQEHVRLGDSILLLEEDEYKTTLEDDYQYALEKILQKTINELNPPETKSLIQAMFNKQNYLGIVNTINQLAEANEFLDNIKTITSEFAFHSHQQLRTKKEDVITKPQDNKEIKKNNSSKEQIKEILYHLEKITAIPKNENILTKNNWAETYLKKLIEKLTKLSRTNQKLNESNINTIIQQANAAKKMLIWRVLRADNDYFNTCDKALVCVIEILKTFPERQVPEKVNSLPATPKRYISFFDNDRLPATQNQHMSRVIRSKSSKQRYKPF